MQTLNVRRGDQVSLGAPLFALESESEQAGKDEAHNRLKAAQAALDNLLSGKRRPELDVVQAQLAQAIAARDLSEAELKRQQKLFADGFISKDHMDAARTAFARDSARVDELKAQGQTARQSIGRLSEIKAAEGEVEAARAVLAQRAWGVAQKSLHAPSAARVHDTYYFPGETVPAGSPIVSLLPADKIKVRFYVPEPRLSSVRTGQEISITCDGCKSAVSARITYLSTQAEYTPPVIYSEQSRAKLVYLAEAHPAAASGLHVGQPVDVRLGK